MARFKLNKIVEYASGGVGNMSFRQVGRRTLFVQKPTNTKPPSEKQLLQREKFKRAMVHAHTILKDPAVKAAYARRVEGQEFQHAFTAAVSDFMKMPTGETGD